MNDTHRKPRRLLSGLLLLATLALGACTARPAPRTLFMQIPSEPASLDPHLAEDGVSLKILANTMEGLVGYDGEGKLQFRLAETAEPSRDYRRFAFTLRRNAKWSDGEPVTTAHFIAGFRRALAPGSQSKLLSMMLNLRGARAYHEGKLPAEGLGVRDEAGQLVIELETPAPGFLEVLTLPTALPYRPGLETAKAPSTGPYRIIEVVADRKLVLEANAHYWGPAPSIPRIELQVVSDESTAMNLFERGSLHILTKVNPHDLRRIREQGLLKTDPFLATYYLAFNVRKPPFDRVRWRRAVAGAVQRTQIVQLLESEDRPALSWIPFGLEGYFPFVPATARVLTEAVAEARREGWKTPIVAGFDSSHRNSIVMEKIQQDVASALGLRLTLHSEDWKSYLRLLQTDAPPVYRFGWQAPFRDPLMHLSIFTSRDPNNHTDWKNPEYDRLVDRIARLAPGPQREQAILRAQRILLEEQAVVVPLFHYAQTHAVRKSVSGFRVSPFGVVRFDELSLR